LEHAKARHGVPALVTCEQRRWIAASAEYTNDSTLTVSQGCVPPHEIVDRMIRATDLPPRTAAGPARHMANPFRSRLPRVLCRHLRVQPVVAARPREHV